MGSHKGSQDGMLSLDLPPRIFINHMDSYHGKKLTAFFLGRPTSGDVWEEACHSPVDGELEVIGTLADYESIQEQLDCPRGRVIDPNNKEDFLGELLSCSLVIYDVTRDYKQISEAAWALYALADAVKSTPLQTALHFLLISPIGTWSSTKQLDPKNPSSPLNELDYPKRQPHQKFKAHLELERQVLTMKNHPELKEKLKALVLSPGITYGAGEDSLNFLFKLAWRNAPYLPVIYPGSNKIPLLHVDELVSVVHSLFQNWPEDRGLLVACELDVITQRKIVENISKHLTTGEIKLIDGLEGSMFKDAISQWDLDIMATNANIEPGFTIDHGMQQQPQRCFDHSIRSIVEEFREVRNIKPVKVIIIGPPVSGKTILANWLAEFYGIECLSKELIMKENSRNWRQKIEGINANEQDATTSAKLGNNSKMFQGQVVLNLKSPNTTLLEKDSVEIANNHTSENNDSVTVDILNKLLTLKLSSPPCKNQGYVLVNYPQTVNQASLLLPAIFKPSNSFTNENNKIQPEVIVMQLDASDEYLCDRVLNLPERVIQRSAHYTIERMLERLRVYRQNSRDMGEFLAENGVQPLIVTIEGAKNEESLLCKFKELCLETIGQPRNYGPTTTTTATPKEFVQRDVEEEARVIGSEADCDEKRDQSMIDWYRRKAEIVKLEEDKLSVISEPMRLYLVKHIFPTLTGALLEIGRLRPEDPLDYLATHLFCNNPDGKMMELQEPVDRGTYTDKFSEEELDEFSTTEKW